MYYSQNGDLAESFMTIITHIKMYMVEKLEMLMLYMYHMGDLTLEILA